MELNNQLHYYIGRSPDEKDKFYVVLSQLAWLASCFFAMFSMSSYEGAAFGASIFRILTLILFIYPIYIVGINLYRQWKRRELYVWDVFLLVFYLIVAILVGMNEFYLREEWVNLLFRL